MSLYRLAAYLLPVVIAGLVVAFALGHPMGSLAVQMGTGR